MIQLLFIWVQVNITFSLSPFLLSLSHPLSAVVCTYYLMLEKSFTFFSRDVYCHKWFSSKNQKQHKTLQNTCNMPVLIVFHSKLACFPITPYHYFPQQQAMVKTLQTVYNGTRLQGCLLWLCWRKWYFLFMWPSLLLEQKCFKFKIILIQS